jgi:hypothetical protein
MSMVHSIPYHQQYLISVTNLLQITYFKNSAKSKMDLYSFGKLQNCLTQNQVVCYYYIYVLNIGEICPVNVKGVD